MPEYWFRYGSTEVSVEVPDEVEHERIAVNLPSHVESSEDVRRLAERVVEEAGGGEAVILYDYSGNPVAEEALHMLLAELDALGFSNRARIIFSAWRLDPRVDVRKTVRWLREARWVGELEKIQVEGVWAAKPLTEARVRVLASAVEPHGITGIAGLRESLALGGAVTLAGEESREPSSMEELWEKTLSTLPSLGLCTVGGEVLVGEAEEADRQARERAEKLFSVEVSKPAEILLAGAGGWPRDASLESSIHLLGLVSQMVEEGGLVGLIAECSLGLGSQGFLEALLGRGGSRLQTSLASLLRTVLESRRVALASTLPRSLASKLLGVRSFDTAQELLTYGFRLYSRGARVVVAETGLLISRAGQR